MRSAVPRRNARPPIPVPGAAGRSPLHGRPTVHRRSFIKPRMWLTPGGYPAEHEYVRRYWTAAIGAGAVADLLRLMQAARRQRSIRRPVNTPALARAGLVVGHDETVFVRSTVPPLPAEMIRRLPQSLRHELAQLTSRRWVVGGGPP